jgi:hypothetical protein
MRQLRARTTLASLVIFGGIVAGAAPIYAQAIAPPDTTSSTPIRGSYVAPPTTTTTVPPRDVQAPTATTIPAIPTPPSLPPEIPKDIKNPCEEKAELCEIPPFPTFPPTPQPAPSLPPEGPPKDVTNPCQDDPELCEIPPFPTFPPTPAPAQPTLPDGYATNDASALRDGLRIYRDARHGAAISLLAAVHRALGQAAGVITTGGLKDDSIGVTCIDSDCMMDFANYCWDLGGAIAKGEGEGGYLCKFYEASASPDLDVTLAGAGTEADAGMTCQAIACGSFINWCDDMGGELESEHVGDGYHEVTCHLADETGAGESE